MSLNKERKVNKNILIVLGGAVLAAVLVAVLVQVSIRGNNKGDGTSHSVEVLVASKDLKVGQDLVEGDLRWQSWPEDSKFRGAIIRQDEQKPEDALTGRLRRDVAKDEPVLKGYLLKENKGNFVAASLDDGMRAMAIKVNAESMVGGFIKPGDFVDVILTYKEKIKANKGDGPAFEKLIELNIGTYATETILQKVKVLAIDQTAELDDEDDEVEVGKTVTLAVSAQQAERLALGTQLGTLVLALRGVGDDVMITSKWPTITDSRMTSIDDEVFAEYQKLKMQSGVQRNIVRIYNGSQVQIVPVQ